MPFFLKPTSIVPHLRILPSLGPIPDFLFIRAGPGPIPPIERIDFLSYFASIIFVLMGRSAGAPALLPDVPDRFDRTAYACSLGPRTGTSIGFPGALVFAVMNACILAMCSSFRWLNRSWFFMYSLTGLYAFGMC